jgi:hypothetical protein
MKHRSTRQLFDYWNEQRGTRSAPERVEVDPTRIRSVLADIFILTFDAGAGHPFRLAGTRVCALFGRELKGEAFLDLWSREACHEVQELLAIVITEAVGVVASAERATATNFEIHSPTKLELLLLPLAHHGRTDARILGSLGPIDRSVFPAVVERYNLSLGPRRYVGRHRNADHCPFSPNPTRRGRLVVYEGGLSARTSDNCALRVPK